MDEDTDCLSVNRRDGRMNFCGMRSKDTERLWEMARYDHDHGDGRHGGFDSESSSESKLKGTSTVTKKFKAKQISQSKPVSDLLTTTLHHPALHQSPDFSLLIP